MHRRFALLTSAAVAVAMTAGCASAGHRADAATDVALAMLTEVANGDGADACARLAPDTAETVAEDDPCEQAILDKKLPGPGKVVGSDVYGQWARVRLDDDTVFLAAFPGGWRVVAAGCTPRSNRPYQCAVEGG
nr:hypothetical protein [uncultured Actinoplanes sp.]